MRALVLNSGLGSRMGDVTKQHPKCMTTLDNGETIISRQLRQLLSNGIDKVVITTGPFAENLEAYCKSLNMGIEFFFVNNPDTSLQDLCCVI